MTPASDPIELTPEEVRRRFRWAKRRGQPAWLWPEVSVARWREAMQAAAAVLGKVLSGRAGRPTLAGDPQALGLAGYTSGVGPLLGLWVEQGILDTDAELARVLARHLAHNRRRAARMEAAAVEAVEALSARGIAVVVLKGAHTARAYFPEIGARPASDIDLLVSAADAAEAEAALATLGFEERSRRPWESAWGRPAVAATPHTLNFVHADDPWSIDLHSALKQYAGPGAAIADLDIAAPLSSRSAWTAHADARVLDQPLLLLHLATHAGAGLHNLTLLRLAELQLVIRADTAAGRLDWDNVLDLGARTEALGYAWPAFKLCEDLAPGVLPGAVLERCAAFAPAAVRRRLGELTPATAQRIDRTSVAEHFMWAQGWRGRLRQIASDLLPAATPGQLWSIYETRAWRLVRGRFGP